MTLSRNYHIIHIPQYTKDLKMNTLKTAMLILSMTVVAFPHECEDISELIQAKKGVGFKLRSIAERSIGTVAKDAHYFIEINNAEVRYLSEGYNSCINGEDPSLSLVGLDTLDRAEILKEEDEG